MWLKLLLLTSFMVVLILLSRLMDMALSGNRSQLLSTHIFLNTIGFSVKQLKRLLDNRGISYEGLLEKTELVGLLDASGGVTEEELIIVNDECEREASADNGDDDSAARNAGLEADANANAVNGEPVVVVGKKSETRFTCGTHFYEEVEDTKDSAWIVNVLPVDGDALSVDGRLWTQIADKCAKFGIRSGVFDCSTDPFLCQRKEWTSARLLLAMPREGVKTKEDVVMKTLLIRPNTKVQQIIDWIHRHLATRVARIESVDDLEKNWLRSASSQDSVKKAIDVKFIFMSTLATPPLILSALAIKFSGRIKFGMLTVDPKKKKSLADRLNRKIPSYLIVMSDRQYQYGYKAGENIRYRSMELLLRTLKPEMNDLFLLSLIVTNLSVGLYFFYMKCSKLWKHIIYWFMHFVKYNCILFLIWLTFLTLYQFPVTERLCTYGYYVCQYLAISPFATIVRYDMQYYYTIPFLTIAFLSLGLAVALVRRKLVSSSVDDNDDHLVFRDWTPWESTLLSYILFRPITMTGFRTMATTSIDLNLEEGMELLIERLAVPNLWLQPELISTEYIKDLPVWSFEKDTNELELSDSDSGGASIDNNEFNAHSEPESKPINCTTNTCKYTTQASLNSSHEECEHFEYSEIGSSSKSAAGQTRVKAGSRRRLEANENRGADALVCQKSNLNANDSHKPSEPERPTDNGIPSAMIACTECAICLEMYRKNQQICGLPCGHNYHQNCIMLWLYRDNHCCPTCRWPTYKQRPKIV